MLFYVSLSVSFVCNLNCEIKKAMFIANLASELYRTICRASVSFLFSQFLVINEHNIGLGLWPMAYQTKRIAYAVINRLYTQHIGLPRYVFVAQEHRLSRLQSVLKL